MAHYAFLDENNIVTEVITGINETELIEGLSTEKWYGNFRNQKCVRTSYNANIRKNYAGIGYLYNEDIDAFIPPKPFNSWILNEEVCQWNAPIPMTEYEGDYNGKRYIWDEENLNWVLASL